MFNAIGIPPDVIKTRWGQWIKSVLYFSTNFVEVKKIINNYEDDGLIVQNCKEIINDFISF